jgi:predicted DNA-binding transcriptional regulator AlpA
VEDKKAKQDAGEALIDVPELADRLGATPDWVYDQVNFGDLPYCRLSPRKIRFHWPTVLVWAAKPR